MAAVVHASQYDMIAIFELIDNNNNNNNSSKVDNSTLPHLYTLSPSDLSLRLISLINNPAIRNANDLVYHSDEHLYIT